MRTVLITALILGLLGHPAGHAQDDPYQRGQAALREQRWTEAAHHFGDAVRTERRPDAALYWQAYALHRGSREAEAKRALRRLEQGFPDSDWLDDARALRLEINDGDAENYDDDELRVYALQQLMHRDPDRALPLVTELARSTRSDETRRQALFVLGMSDDERAAAAIAQIARDSANPRLQVEAIHLLGSADSDAARRLLAELYRPQADPTVRRAVIEALIAGDEPAPLVDIVRSERDPELQSHAIFALGAMDETEALRGLYPQITDPGLRAHVLQAFAIAEDVDELKRIIAAERDPALRTAAIRSLGIADDHSAVGVLAQIQPQASTPDEQRAILETLVMIDDGAEVALAIARSSSDPAIQRQAIQTLAILDADVELRQLYGQVEDLGVRRALLEQIAIAEDEDALIEVLRTEKTPELRLEAIRGVVIAEADEAAPVLVTIYPEAAIDEKHAIIETLMILEEEEELARLIKIERDPTLKRRILDALMAVDSDLAEEYLFEWIED